MSKIKLYTGLLLISMLVACGKKSGDVSVEPVVNTPNPTAQACTAITSDPQDTQEAQALTEISKMSKKQCQQNFQQVVQFYEQTKNMTDDQRKKYFQQMTAGIDPQPPPPPKPCSEVFEALKKCAGA